MKICILGSTGLLGQALVKEAKSRNIDFTGVARKESDVNLDITNDVELCEFLKTNKFDFVINTCAIVNHKLCDDNIRLAYAVNARPSAVLTNLAQELNFKYVFISTDGYFCENKDRKHDENTPVKLLNEYARTKFAGEMFTLTDPNALVIRTNIVGFKGHEQPTFVEWAIHELKNQNEMTLFEDYFTSSISVTQFSKALFDILPKNPCGILNIASSEVFSKAEFITTLAKEFDFSLSKTKTGTVNSLTSKRADSLGLDVQKAENILDYKLPTLDEVIKQLKKEYYEIR